jgi:hypothetical protein
MLITNGTITTPGVRRRTIHRQVNVGPITLRVVSIVIVAAAALIALAQSTQSATKNYKVEELKKAVTNKEKEISDMESEAVRLTALQRLVESQTPSPTASPSPQLEESKQINYLPGSVNASLSQAATTNSIQ